MGNSSLYLPFLISLVLSGLVLGYALSVLYYCRAKLGISPAPYILIKNIVKGYKGLFLFAPFYGSLALYGTYTVSLEAQVKKTGQDFPFLLALLLIYWGIKIGGDYLFNRYVSYRLKQLELGSVTGPNRVTYLESTKAILYILGNFGMSNLPSVLMLSYYLFMAKVHKGVFFAVVGITLVKHFFGNRIDNIRHKDLCEARKEMITKNKADDLAIKSVCWNVFTKEAYEGVFTQFTEILLIGLFVFSEGSLAIGDYVLLTSFQNKLGYLGMNLSMLMNHARIIKQHCK